jgi:flagellar protein FliS
MFSSNLNPAKAYQNVGTTSGAMSASPHGLVIMLFEGAQAAISSARMHMQAGHGPEKAQAISKAVAIVQDGLMASLDREAGGELAEQLFALYEYMVSRLVDANVTNHPEPLEETQKLLGDLEAAWKAIGNHNQNPASGNGR